MTKPGLAKTKSQLTGRIVASNLALVIVTSLVWYGATSIMHFSNVVAAVIAFVVGLIAAVLVSLLQRQLIFKPLVVLQQALAYVSASGQGVAAPDIRQSFLGKEFTTDLVHQIYELASMSQGLAHDIQQRFDLLRTVVDGAPMALVGLNKEQKLVYANYTGQQFLPVPYKDAVGKTLQQLFQFEFSGQETYDQWLSNSRQNKIHEIKAWQRIKIPKLDHTYRIVDLAVAFNKEESHGFETILVMIDRTDEYMADESEMDFVAVAAHELRSPITIMRGYLDALDEETRNMLNVEQLNLLQKVVASAEQLAGYVNNILSVARVDQDNLNLQIREENWTEVVRQAYNDLSLRATAHGRVLKISLPEQLPTVAVDRVGALMVINNLVDNAVKYSPEGGEIVIAVTMNQGMVETTVQDNGIGIPEAVVGNLFSKFYRSHRSRKAVGGTGLGLYLCKAIVDEHNGTIWVSSKEGQGSTFGFTLPTYASIADQDKNKDNSKGIIRGSHGWIKNHSLYRR